MTKSEKQRLADVYASVYRAAEIHADQLDPKRQRRNEAAKALDRVASGARWAHYYLIGTFPNMARRS